MSLQSRLADLILAIAGDIKSLTAALTGKANTDGSNASGSWPINSASATKVAVTNEINATTMYPLLSATTGSNQDVKTTTGRLSFNSSTGQLTATSFAGNGAALTSLTAGNLSGTVAIARGGTGTTTAPNAGGIIYATSTTAYASSAAGTSGQLLQSNGTASAPSWVNASSLTVGTANVANSANAVSWTNVTGRPTGLLSFTNDAGYITSSGSCAFATSAGEVAWTNVTGRPTAVSSFTNDAGYLTAASTIPYATAAGTATTANTATQANLTFLDQSAGNNNDYPLVFTSGSVTGASSLLGHLTGGYARYNPTTNTATINITGSAASATTATSATSATNATNATNINVTGDTTSAGTFLVMFTDATSGNAATKVSSAKLTFQPSIGRLNASQLGGNGANITALNMNNAGSGTLAVARGGSGAGAPTASGAIVWTSSTTAYGYTAVGTAGQLLQSGGSGAPSWVSASTLTVQSAAQANTALSADYATTAGSATTASTAMSADAAVAIGTTSVTTTGAYPLLFADNALGGNRTVGFNAAATYDPATNTANIDIDGNAKTANSASLATYASGASVSDALNVSFPATDPNGDYPLLFGQNKTQALQAVSGTTGFGGTFNPSTNTANINISGSAATATTATSAINATNATSATIATNLAQTDDTTTNATYYPTFAIGTGTTSAQRISSTKLTYNPSTGRLNATAFGGNGANLTALSAANISAGTLAVARGGTGTATAPVAGGITYGASTTALATTAAGTAGQLLTSGGAAAPTWTNASSLSVASAATLTTARLINGVSFNGSADITIPATLGNSVTFNNAGTGAVSGTTFNGTAAQTISYNTIGAPSATGAGASGSWGISITGNAATATSATSATTANSAATLTTARTINGVSFDGSANITLTANNPNAVTFNNAGTGAASGTTYDGSAAQTISYNSVGAPSTTGANASGTWDISITGNAATATSATSATSATTATQLQTARNIALTGDVTGTASFNGTANASITATLANTGIAAGTYPIASLTVDAKGRLTAALRSDSVLADGSGLPQLTGASTNVVYGMLLNTSSNATQFTQTFPTAGTTVYGYMIWVPRAITVSAILVGSAVATPTADTFIEAGVWAAGNAANGFRPGILALSMSTTSTNAWKKLTTSTVLGRGFYYVMITMRTGTAAAPANGGFRYINNSPGWTLLGGQDTPFMVNEGVANTVTPATSFTATKVGITTSILVSNPFSSTVINSNATSSGTFGPFMWFIYT